MEEKYLATAMKRIAISQNDYIYVKDKVISGTLDKKRNVFITDSEEEYKNITNFSDLENSEKYYANLTKVITSSKKANDANSLTKIINEYEENCGLIFYYLGKVNEEDFMLMPIDKRPYLKALSKIKENSKDFNEYSANKTIENKKVVQSDESDGEDLYIKGLKDLVASIIEGKYSNDELSEIKYHLVEQKEELESAIASVELEQGTFGEKLDTIPKLPTQQTNPNESEIHIDDIFEKVTKTLIAQEGPARRAIVEISRLADSRKKDYGILLTGESGVGKTLLMSLIARYINRPLLIIDSTQLTAPGYVGKSIEEYLWELYEETGKDLKKSERAIIYFDEIDKKGSKSKSDISGQAVLNTLLKFLDGTSYMACKNPQRQTEKSSVKISTENMIVIAGGAFLDVYKKEEKNKVGFTTIEEEKSVDVPEITDFVNKAMMTKEFMGRVPVIVHLNSLDIEGLRRILTDSDESILKLQEEVFNNKGVKLTTKDGYILSISQQALDRKIGARGLNKLVADSTWIAYDEICSHPGEYEEVILTEKTAEDPKNYQLVKKRTSKETQQS